MKSILIIAILAVIAAGGHPADAQSVSGDWSGNLKLNPNTALKLVFHIDSNGPAVEMDSPDQGAFGIKGVVDHLSEDSVALRVPSLMMSYNGSRRDGRISGTFRQGGLSLPLILEPGATKLSRPQTPVAPFPYSTEEVTIDAGNGVELSGTLTVPPGARKKMPVVVMVTGSGLQNRDEELFGHKPFAVIADYLARNGIASLRYDDRGFGKSKGDVASATSADFAADARAVAGWLRANGDFGSVGLLGHSEGGSIGFILGAQQGVLDFLVSIAGPAVRGDSILTCQNMTNLAKSGITGPIADRFETALRKTFRLKIEQPELRMTDELLAEIYPTWNESAITRKLADGLRSFTDNSNPWMSYFIAYSPAADLAAISVPALLIYGEKDMQVPCRLNADAASKSAPGAAVKEYKGLNHLMQHATTGNVEEYAAIEETISEEVLADIVAFIKALPAATR